MALELSRELAENVRDIALGAGEAIKAAAQSPIKVDTKSDQSPVTAADRAAHLHIASQLVKLTPNVTVISEEGDHTLKEPDEPFWLVDPLDGTKEFIAGNGEYTVNIALIEQRHPVLGVVHTPSLNQTFYSFDLGQAFRQDGSGSIVPIQARPPAPRNTTALASRSHLDEETQAYLGQQKVSHTRQIGSSLKFCLIAAGEADLYPRFGPTMEWDTAAGHAILLAAGGCVVTADGHALTYAKPGFRNPSFIARGRDA